MVQITFSVQARQPFSLVKNQLASGSLQASSMTNVMGGVVDFCQNLPALNALWSIILQEAEWYTEEAIARLEAIWEQRYTYLSSRQQN
jgi:hypothetical protein